MCFFPKEGGCSAPVAAHAELHGGHLSILAGVWSLDGSKTRIAASIVSRSARRSARRFAVWRRSPSISARFFISAESTRGSAIVPQDVILFRLRRNLSCGGRCYIIPHDLRIMVTHRFRVPAAPQSANHNCNARSLSENSLADAGLDRIHYCA